MNWFADLPIHRQMNEQFSKSQLLDVMYGYEPMWRSLAEELFKLRCLQKLPYYEIPCALNTGFGIDFSLGKELCQKAKTFLDSDDNRWD